MKVIFLDFDGVISLWKENEETYDIDMIKLGYVIDIAKITGAKVAIISSTRGVMQPDGTPAKTKKCKFVEEKLQEAGIELTEELIRIRSHETININGEKVNGRGAEVKHFLNTHSVESFVILDDEDFDWQKYGLDKNWIKVDYDTDGLKKEHIQKVIDILNR